MLPDVIFRRTAEIFWSTAYNVGSIYCDECQACIVVFVIKIRLTQCVDANI